MLAQGAQRNAESQNAINAALIGAAGNVASGAIGSYAKMGGGMGGGSIAGYRGQQYTPQTSMTGGRYYAPVSGAI